MIKQIDTLTEIDGPGTFVSKTFPRVLPSITIDIEDERYCVAVGGRWIMNGWKIRYWKTLKGCRNSIQDWAVRDEQGMGLWNAYVSKVA